MLRKTTQHVKHEQYFLPEYCKRKKCDGVGTESIMKKCKLYVKDDKR